MKKSVLLVIFLQSLLGFSQRPTKDTLYFQLNHDYIVNRATFQGLNYHPDIKDLLKVKIQKTETYGLFTYNLDTTYFNLEPDEIHSLLDYIERKFNYYPGPYNRIVNKFKLKEKFLDTYEILLVDENRVIKPKYLDYVYLYPYRKGKNTIQNPVRDTLVFNATSKFIKPSKDSDEYFIEWDSGSESDYISFAKRETIQSLNPQGIKNLNDFIYWIVYTTRLSRPLSDMEVYEYLSKYVIFFKGDGLYHRVVPIYSTE